MEISRVAPGVRRQQRRFFHLALRQGHRLTLGQLLQKGSHLLQNGAIGAAAAERQGGNGAVKRPLAKGALQLQYRLRQQQAIVAIGLVRLQQRRQLVAAQGGGQPRAPGLRIGGDLRRRPAGLGEQRLLLVELRGGLAEGRWRFSARGRQPAGDRLQHLRQTRLKLVAGKGLLKTGVDQQGDKDRGVNRHPQPEQQPHQDLALAGHRREGLGVNHRQRHHEKGQSQLAQHPHQIDGAEKERHGGRQADQRVVIGPLDDQQHAAERHADGDKKDHAD
ncbi:hypothetical protein SB00059_00855 [Klebsiella quasipneumoniae subsp. quasipneumoniae]|nr:hypothetical protein SB00059_00855 [Klebsiella quasipneumoniae subsp. quasipneumoniae]